MTKERFDRIKNVWNQMEDLQRWQFLQNNQQLGFVVQLDNDGTFVSHPDLEDDLLDFDEFIGWADGIMPLLKALGVQGEPV